MKYTDPDGRSLLGTITAGALFAGVAAIAVDKAAENAGQTLKENAKTPANSASPDPENNNDDEHKDKFQETLDYIKKNNKAPDGFKGGREYHNNGSKLPSVDKNGNKIEYKEWDVNPQQKGANRGAERLVTGSDGSAYKTVDHYKTFIQME